MFHLSKHLFVVLALSLISEGQLVADTNVAAVASQPPRPKAVCLNFRLSDSVRPAEMMAETDAQIVSIEGFGPTEGLAHWLVRQHELEELSLICMSLNEGEVGAIVGLRKLSRLDLRGCQISADLLDRLHGMGTLELDLRGTIVMR